MQDRASNDVRSGILQVLQYVITFLVALACNEICYQRKSPEGRGKGIMVDSC